MIVSQEPTSSGVVIELTEQSDNENPYLETPNMSDLMPVIFPGGGGGESGGGGASGDWFSEPVSGDGMLAEIATFCGYASDWTFSFINGEMVAERERFLGSCTISRVGAGAWTEQVEHRRGFDEPLKRLSTNFSDGAGYYMKRYVFDGWDCGRTATKQESYPIYDYYSPRSFRDSGEYSLEKWLWDREHNEQHMPPERWIEYRCPSFTAAMEDHQVFVGMGDSVVEYKNIRVHCESDEQWHIFECRGYHLYAEYDRYVDGVFIAHEVHDGEYSFLLYHYPEKVLLHEEARQHYPQIGIERVVFSYKPSALPVILGGSLPAYLVLIVLVMLCAVLDSGATSFIDSDIDEEKKGGKKDANG